MPPAGKCGLQLPWSRLLGAHASLLLLPSAPALRLQGGGALGAKPRLHAVPKSRDCVQLHDGNAACLQSRCALHLAKCILGGRGCSHAASLVRAALCDHDCQPRLTAGPLIPAKRQLLPPRLCVPASPFPLPGLVNVIRERGRLLRPYRRCPCRAAAWPPPPPLATCHGVPRYSTRSSTRHRMAANPPLCVGQGPIGPTTFPLPCKLARSCRGLR